MIRELHDRLNRDDPRHAALKVVEAHLRTRYHEWKQDKFYLTHGTASIWIASGRGYLRVYENGTELDWIGMVWRWRLWSIIGDKVKRFTRDRELRDLTAKAERLVDNFDPPPQKQNPLGQYVSVSAASQTMWIVS